MGNIFEITNNGYMKLKNLTSDPSGTEGMVIYNSTDKKVKYHDGVSWVDTGASALPWYMDATQYTVYDDFPTGTINTAKWETPVTDSYGQVSCSNSNNAGGTAWELYLSFGRTDWPPGSSDEHIISKTLPTGINNMWWRMYWGANNATTGGSTTYFTLNGTAYTLGTERTGGYVSINIIKNGSNWDVWVGGKLMGSQGTQPTTIGFWVSGGVSGASQSGASGFIYVDDIRYN